MPYVRVRKRSTRKKIVIACCMFGLAVILAGYAFLSWERYTTIREMVGLATARQTGKPVEALISFLNLESTTVEQKNRVIWVLGEIRDKRAAPVLLEYYCAGECDHDEHVCQQELRKALRKINGSLPNPYFWQDRLTKPAG